jgi:UDP-N-acetylmuramoyl-tripeptide--D-alanyl-D-alanine ligase
MKEITAEEAARLAGGTVEAGNPENVISHVSTDSRDIKNGATLFVPVIGEKTDAHRFLPDVEKKGASAAFISEDISFENGYRPGETGMAVIRVKDSTKALQDLAYGYRDRIRIPLVGITGSVGKTTTREMVALALSAGYRVFKTPGNRNSQIGVPLTLFEIGIEDEIGVIEMGISLPGEMKKISRIVRPSCAVMTNIGTAHIGQLGSRENIRAEKADIQYGMPEGGTVFLNADDDLLYGYAAKKGNCTVYYGTVPGKGNYADGICLKDGCASFTAHVDGNTAEVHLKVFGRHQVLNAMAALSVASFYHVGLSGAAEKLSGFTGFKHRAQILHCNGITVIDDTYNASPVSMKAAIDILQAVSVQGRKVAVLADMKELGERERELHFEIGNYLSDGHRADVLFTLGSLAAEIAAAVRKSGARIEIFSFSDAARMEEKLKEYLKPGDAVLLKGSNSMNLSAVADRMCGNGT